MGLEGPVTVVEQNRDCVCNIVSDGQIRMAIIIEISG